MSRLLIMLAAFLCSSLFSVAQLGRIVLSPPIHIVDMDDSKRVYSYELSNQGESPVSVGVEVSNWTKDETNSMVLIPPEEGSLDQWIIASPLEFTVPPKSSQTVRFSIRPAVELSEGEHRAAFVFRQKDIKTSEVSSSSEDLVIRNLFEIKSAVYATVGRVVRSGTILDYRLSAGSLEIFLKSDGNAHVRPSGRFQIWRTSDFPGEGEAIQIDPKSKTLPPGLLYFERLRNKSILQGQSQWVPHSLKNQKIGPGDYTVFIYGKLGEQVVQTVQTLTVHP